SFFGVGGVLMHPYAGRVSRDRPNAKSPADSRLRQKNAKQMAKAKWRSSAVSSASSPARSSAIYAALYER
ncbi:MAG: hypothetical protein ACXU87_19830, partial [Xanthobacteraceae bacterium]